MAADYNPVTPREEELFNAIFDCDNKKARGMISSGEFSPDHRIQPSERDDIPHSLIYIALDADNLKLAKFLINSGVKIRRLSYGEINTQIDYAISDFYPEKLELISRHVELRDFDNEDDETLIQRVIRNLEEQGDSKRDIAVRMISFLKQNGLEIKRSEEKLKRLGLWDDIISNEIPDVKGAI